MSGVAENITRHFKGDWHGNQGLFPAPGHGPKDRGVSVKDAGDGDVVFHSFNGADWREIKDECRRVGLLPGRGIEPAAPATWRETGVYDYVGADGAVAYRTVRKEKRGEGKRFVAQRPDGRGGWINGLGDVERVVYRLPDLLAADPTAIVYVVEGERKADKLADWGMVATAVAFGAKGWRDSYAAALAGRTVGILPDNDDPGRAFAERVRESVERAGGAAVIVDLPGLGIGEDVIDWSGRGGSAFDLRALTAAALKAPAEDLMAIDDVADWEGLTVPPRRWLVKDWLPIGEAALLTGAGSIGKSLVSQQLAATVAVGHPFFGVGVEQARSLYITCEDGREEAQRRHRDIASTLGGRIARGQCLVKSWKGELGLELVTFDSERRMRPTDRYRRLRATVLTAGIRFLVLDNTSHVFGGDENVKREVAAFVNLLNGLAEEIDGVVLLLGHPNKTGLNNPDAGNANQFGGSVAWENQVRSRMFMSGMKDDNDARELSNPKANYSAKGATLTFRWHSGAFVRDVDLPDDRRSEMAAVIRANSDDAAFLACLEERTRQHMAVSEKTSSTYAPTVFERMPESKRIGKGRLEAAMERLIRVNRIERALLPWKRDRKDVFGLRLTCADGCADAASAHCADAPDVSAPNAPDTHSISKDISGAATGAAAPIEEAAPDPTDRHTCRIAGMILADGEDGDDVDL
ncbi:AAA family ATPase [Sphingomonas qilianensis]|uniref:AAA family ATPase n=1 Tax=Sphingomonas qilianensis TaxID=1736690 RepID=A0ABU9XWC3_9SPHN